MAEPLSEEEIFRRKARQLWTLAAGFLNEVQYLGMVPERNCSCHISPPCGDCENFGGIRGFGEELELMLREMEKEVML